MKGLIALEEVPLNGPLRGFGPLGLEGGEDAPTVFNQFISTTIGLMTILAIVWFILTLLSGAIGIITAGGDKGKLETARQRITNGLIGLVVVIAAVFIVDFIGTLMGIPEILNPAEMLNRIITL